MAYMAHSCHPNSTWRSYRGNRVHGTKPLPGICCAASLSPAVEIKKLPFGGAIVSKLVGSVKILKNSQYAHHVPLLGPGMGIGQPYLPFGASLECVMRSSFEERLHAPAGAPSSARSGTLTDDGAQATSSRMLDVLYVLAGTGIASTADGTVRKLHAGDSLVAWHNTCELRAISPDDQPPAVLKFHFPASVLMLPPGALVAPSPSHADLQILVNDCQGGSYDGELSQQEATDMLSGVQQRTSRAITHLYDQLNQPQPTAPAGEPTTASLDHKQTQLCNPQMDSVSSELEPQGRGGVRSGVVAAAPAHNHHQQQHQQHQQHPQHQPASRAPNSNNAVSSNNILPLVAPFLRRLLHSAVAPAVGGVRLLTSALRRPTPAQRNNLAAAAATASTAAASSAQAQLQQHPQPPLAGGCGPSASLALGGSDHSHSSWPSVGSSTGCVVLQRALEDFKAFRFPRQTNKLAFVFDPSELGLSLSFGVEVFEPGHHTPLHLHKTAHELFFVLAGEGEAFCDGAHFPVRAGDCVVFPPRSVHGIDNTSDDSKLYCLQLMTPNEAFVEHVQSGEAMGRLDDEDLCNLTSRHC